MWVLKSACKHAQHGTFVTFFDIVSLCNDISLTRPGCVEMLITKSLVRVDPYSQACPAMNTMYNWPHSQAIWETLVNFPMNLQ